LAPDKGTSKATFAGPAAAAVGGDGGPGGSGGETWP
jgi:hypothetical protein